MERHPITGWKIYLPLFLMWLRVAVITFRTAGSLRSFFVLFSKIIELKKALVGNSPIKKLAKAGGKYLWNMNAPVWPSVAFDRFFQLTAERLHAGERFEGESVRFVMLSITKKCAMSCEHCFEWDEINKKDTLDLDTLKKIVSKYQRLGASQFLLGGGEPMARFPDLLEIVKHGSKLSDFWISTSGIHFTAERASRLKAAGLRGAAFSLDHFDAESNNRFRGHRRAFDFIEKGMLNAHRAGLATALSLCTTRSFITRENLMRYAELARSWGAGFIQLLEPRAVGRYAGKDVLLGEEHYAILDDFYLAANNNRGYESLPRIIHTSYNQRRLGCEGAGLYSIMIDTDGYVNACPFCRSKRTFALDDTALDGIGLVQAEGCHMFDSRLSRSVLSQSG